MPGGDTLQYGFLCFCCPTCFRSITWVSSFAVFSLVSLLKGRPTTKRQHNIIFFIYYHSVLSTAQHIIVYTQGLICTENQWSTGVLGVVQSFFTCRDRISLLNEISTLASVSDATREDCGNYSCVAYGPHNTLLASVVYNLHIRGPFFYYTM